MAGDRLPVEVEFPEAFAGGSARVMDAELSRLISVSDDRRERALASMACQRAMLGWALRNGVQQTYAIVEDYLIRRLDRTGVPHEMLTSPKALATFGGSVNYAVRIDPGAMATQVASPFRVPLGTYLFFRGISRHSGLGSAGRNLMVRRRCDSSRRLVA